MESKAKSSSIMRLPLLPLRNKVLFPQMLIPLFVGREKSIRTLEKVIADKTYIVAASQKDVKTDDPDPDGIYTIGNVASVIQHMRFDGIIKAILDVHYRVLIKSYVDTDTHFIVDVERLKEEPVKNNEEAQALLRTVRSSIENYIKINKQIPEEVLSSLSSIEHCGELADTIAPQLNLRFQDKQRILEIADPFKRLQEIFRLITKEIQVLKIEKKIRTRVKEQMERSQKEYYLNEQLQAIQKELGDKDDFQKEIKNLEARGAKKKWGTEVKEKFQKEVSRLKMMSSMSSEATVVRNYVDWLLDLPWEDFVNEKNDITKAQKILNQDHWGLKKAKERILEHLAVRKLTKNAKGPVICFLGPPGVGKTSLGQSIASCLNRPFCRISLGGVQDEAELRGHRRTYVGAMPGKIIQALKKVKKGNPVMLLDEVDKMGGVNFRGDPSSALLEILDPEQNHTFQDHYLEVDYDLSNVLFICTANSLHTLTGPLLDRMEVISIEGYIDEEKINIAQNYLIPRQIKRHGLDEYDVKITDEALKQIIGYYTREAGVRQLERVISKILRKIAKKIVSTKDVKPKTTKSKTKTSKTSKTAKPKSTKQFSVHLSSLKDLEQYLGSKEYRWNQLEDDSLIGLTNGLAWTEAGGDTLVVESVVVPGTGKYTLTGQLGEVMKESCSASLSYVRSRSLLFGIKNTFFKQHDFHIHVPEGAIPKDGPSAGVAIITSLVSAILRIPVKNTVAMTGEITLRGRVLPIGGLKEKILAAHRLKIKKVIIPKENEKDLKDIPKKVLKDTKVVMVHHVDQVLVEALEIGSSKELFKFDPRMWAKNPPVSKSQKAISTS